MRQVCTDLTFAKGYHKSPWDCQGVALEYIVKIYVLASDMFDCTEQQFNCLIESTIVATPTAWYRLETKPSKT